MNKQLLEIFKKRYALFVLFGCLAIIGIFLNDSRNNSNRWQEYNHPNTTNTIASEATGSTELLTQYNMENQSMVFVETGPNSNVYYSFYFNENFLAAIIILAAGFLMFFVDLKTGFNSFLFSLGFPRKHIYFAKYLFIGLPLLLSVLVGKLLMSLILFFTIPTEFMNLSIPELLLGIGTSWLTYVFYFACGAFIGLVSGNTILGLLTIFGFGLSINFSIPGFVHAVQYALYHDTERYPPLMSNLFSIFITKSVPLWQGYAVFILLSVVLIIFGNTLYNRLSLEKNGNYLLFDNLRLPTLVLITFYVPIAFVFSGSNFIGIDKSPFPSSFLFSLLAFIIAGGVIFSKEIIRLQTKLTNNLLNKA
ncbi:hypothetical protein [Enterococcus sp. BWR-S5]|uniref:hypothetical protein n=1 Tax=Enterococcus sp. BWR-S5 TaxID=2787714 RepID=UPI00192183EF|nr:hypothetical protein [Enterococcus sp. BWR-S5]MBL1224430.1 hypothetical protein [Enterococcus sp. BWR-S5]